MTVLASRYCNTCSTPDLKKYTDLLLRELNHFQRRAHAQNEIKAKAHRRFVVGFREVQNHLRINKVRLVVVATDCENCEGEQGTTVCALAHLLYIFFSKSFPIFLSRLESVY